MSLGFEKRLTPAPGGPGERQAEEAEPRLNIDVIFTSVRETLAALKRAGELATRLNARITLVVPQVVSYPAPLESPPVLIEFNENRFRVIASESSVETTVRIYLCRDRWEALQLVLKRRSVVVLGGRKRWWPTEERRLARKLRRSGHEVIYTEME
jgi:hypothetical protein